MEPEMEPGWATAQAAPISWKIAQAPQARSRRTPPKKKNLRNRPNQKFVSVDVASGSKKGGLGWIGLVKPQI